MSTKASNQPDGSPCIISVILVTLTGPGWTPAHDAALEEFKRTGVDEVQIASVLGEIRGDIGAFHTHRDAEFNLLFHASIEGSLPAVKVSPSSAGRIRSQKMSALFSRV